VACFLGERGSTAKLGSNGHFVPCYPFPEEAVSSLARAVEYAENCKKPVGEVPKVRRHRTGQGAPYYRKGNEREQSTAVLAGGNRNLPIYSTATSSKTAPMALAKTPDEAAAAAAKMGFPVVVKLVSATITHKTDVGGVVVGVKSKNEVIKAFDTIKANLTKTGAAKRNAGRDGAEHGDRRHRNDCRGNTGPVHSGR